MQHPTLRSIDRVWFRTIQVESWLESSLIAWRSLVQSHSIQLVSIVGDLPERIWNDADSIFEVVSELVKDCQTASIDDSRIEFEVRSLDPRHEWLVFSLRDFSGGRSEDWRLSQELVSMSKRLGGFIDVANEAGRKTTFSLHIPSGKIETWLRRNSHATSVYSIRTESFHRSNETDCWLQRLLYLSGSYQLLDGSSYLLARMSELNTQAWDSEILRHLTPHVQNVQLQVDRLGSMSDLLNRLEAAARKTSTSPCPQVNASTIESDKKLRFDGVEKLPLRDTNAAIRQRPRRVSHRSVA
jgi:hypothetical protein